MSDLKTGQKVQILAEVERVETNLVFRDYSITALLSEEEAKQEAKVWAAQKFPSTISTEDDRRRHSGAIGYIAALRAHGLIDSGLEKND